jgi:hypothetical protein
MMTAIIHTNAVLVSSTPVEEVNSRFSLAWEATTKWSRNARRTMSYRMRRMIPSAEGVLNFTTALLTAAAFVLAMVAIGYTAGYFLVAIFQYNVVLGIVASSVFYAAFLLLMSMFAAFFSQKYAY